MWHALRFYKSEYTTGVCVNQHHRIWMKCSFTRGKYELIDNRPYMLSRYRCLHLLQPRSEFSIISTKLPFSC